MADRRDHVLVQSLLQLPKPRPTPFSTEAHPSKDVTVSNLDENASTYSALCFCDPLVKRTVVSNKRPSLSATCQQSDNSDKEVESFSHLQLRTVLPR